MHYLSQIDLSGTVLGAIVACIGTLAGAIGYLHRQMVARLDSDRLEIKSEFKEHKVETEKEIRSLDEKLALAAKATQESDLKALRAEILAHSPCHLPECPKRSASYSIGGCMPPTHTA